jgi:hypothetical protein
MDKIEAAGAELGQATLTAVGHQAFKEEIKKKAPDVSLSDIKEDKN